MKIQNFLSRTILCAVSLANVPFSAGCHAVVSATDKPAPQPKVLTTTARLTKSGIPIRFTLPKTSYVTLVIEDAAGKRVRNLVAETRFPAGENIVRWDGYDDGTRNEAGDLVRRRVKPGRYALRGLTHDGIHLRYEFPLYSGGNPPWKTVDKSGGWMADHWAPTGALFLPAGTSPFGDGKPQLLLSSLVAEAGDPLILVDKTGQRIHGEHFFGWGGGVSLARDMGREGRKDYFAYILGGWEESVTLTVLNQQKQGALVAEYKVENKMPREPGTIGLSLAVYNNLAVVSLPIDNKLLFIDTKAGKVLGTTPMAAPRGVYFDAKGSLFAISAGQIKRFQPRRSDAGVDLGAASTIVKSNLEQAHSLTGDAAGNLYVADWGKSHQVKVFDATGKLVRTIGKPGGLQVGLYDEQRMQRPQGLTIDDEGRLWVAEADHLPKRISVWKTSGQFVMAKYGPSRYGGGGTIDAQNPSRVFYADYGGIMEFELDWKAGTSRLKAIVSRTDVQGFDPLPGENTLPEYPLHVGGRLYLVGMYQGGRGNTNTAIFLVDEKTHIGRPVAYVGTDRWWEYVAKREDIKALAPGGKNEQFMAWSDLNNDSKVQPNEFTYRAFSEKVRHPDGDQRNIYGFREFFFNRDLSLNGVWSLHVPAPTIRPDGVPVYDLAKAKFLLPLGDPAPQVEDGIPLFPAPDGWLLTGESGYKNGKLLWSYPSQDGSPLPTQPGQMIDPTRILGPVITVPEGKAGAIYGMNGEKGNIYLMTSDGLFIQQLGGDMRVRPLMRLPKATRGMLVDGYSFEDEHFHPTLTLTKDGRLLLVAGKEHSSIFQVEGFDTVERRNFGSLNLTSSTLSALPATKTEKARKQIRQTLAVKMVSKTPIVDGNLNDWPTNTAWAKIDESASAAVAISATHLHAAWKTNNAKLLTNAGGDARFLFKKGGALDIMLGTDDKADADRHNPAAVWFRTVSRGAVG